MPHDLHSLDAPPTMALPAGTVPARPLLDRYLFERRLGYRGAGRELDLSHEGVRQMCLAFDNPKRLKPSRTTAAQIEAWSSGAVPAWTFVDTPEARAAFFNPPAPPLAPAPVTPLSAAQGGT